MEWDKKFFGSDFASGKTIPPNFFALATTERSNKRKIDRALLLLTSQAVPAQRQSTPSIYYSAIKLLHNNHER
jgi:hypothetical protein